MCGWNSLILQNYTNITMVHGFWLEMCGRPAYSSWVVGLAIFSVTEIRDMFFCSVVEMFIAQLGKAYFVFLTRVLIWPCSDECQLFLLDWELSWCLRLWTWIISQNISIKLPYFIWKAVFTRLRSFTRKRSNPTTWDHHWYQYSRCAKPPSINKAGS